MRAEKKIKEGSLLGVFLAIAFLAGLLGTDISGFLVARAACEQLGWFPTEFGLKDHSVFTYDNMYYVVSIHYPEGNVSRERKFAYARSPDMCTWETLPWIIAQRRPDTWDEMAVWAPFVFVEGGTYYMFYTGVTSDFTQSILLATTTNPANAASWEEKGLVFQPDHPGMVWEAGAWADNRDATVIKVEDTYYMYYTGTDEDGSILGLATSTSLYGPWDDWGSVLKLDLTSQVESATVYKYGGLYYLIYNNTREGQEYRIGASPGGPWDEAVHFAPGWAHEIWDGLDGKTYSSYLSTHKTSFGIEISPLTWDTFYAPPVPIIGLEVFHIVLPLIFAGGWE